MLVKTHIVSDQLGKGLSAGFCIDSGIYIGVFVMHMYTCYKEYQLGVEDRHSKEHTHDILNMNTTCHYSTVVKALFLQSSHSPISKLIRRHLLTA